MGKRFLLLLLWVVVGLTSCGSDDKSDNTTVLDPPAMVSSDPENGATDIATGDITIVLTFDQNVTSPSVGHSSVTLGDAVISDVSANLKEVTIEATGLVAGNEYTLVIPENVIYGPTNVSTENISITFTTKGSTVVDVDITTSLVTSNPSTQAQNVYDYLLENYQTNIVSGVHANVAWNQNEAEWVKYHTGKYPVINTVDYIQLHYAPANWIDYSDITFLEEWWNNNGLVAADWHWMVPPTEADEDDLSSYVYNTETTFSASNVVIDGTWENTYAKANLEEMAGYLKLLQDKDIPVIWRPLHEAAGNIYNYTDGEAWFWWGYEGAEAYVALWKFMFDYFEEQGLNNLIWVWTTQTGDDAFYPGDDYVDIVGRDIYTNSDASDIASQFAEIQNTYSTKMVTLSEMGDVATISEEWSAGAKWSYFMPWYDYDRTVDMDSDDFLETDHGHADITWWEDALDQDYVITRDEMPSLK